MSEGMGEAAARDVVQQHSEVIVGVIGDRAGGGHLDIVGLGTRDGAYHLSVEEAKGGSDRLGSRTVADGTRAQQGSLPYLRDIVAGNRPDPRVLARLLQMADDPQYPGLAAQLRGAGIEVSYELVTARTSGTVTVSKFQLVANALERVMLRLGPDGKLEMVVTS
jgi:hypothetical protein